MFLKQLLLVRIGFLLEKTVDLGDDYLEKFGLCHWFSETFLSHVFLENLGIYVSVFEPFAETFLEKFIESFGFTFNVMEAGQVCLQNVFLNSDLVIEQNKNLTQEILHLNVFLDK